MKSQVVQTAKRCLAVFLLLYTVLSAGIPIAYATNSSGIEITGGGDGVKISPGSYPSLGGGTLGVSEGINDALGRTQTIAVMIFSVCVLISFLMMLFSISKLSTSAGNPRQRQVALVGIVACGVSILVFGGMGVYVGFLGNFLQ